MERLVVDNGYGIKSLFIDGEIIHIDNTDVLKLAEKLYNYEQREDKGLLLHMPCKVGMHIWVNGVLGVGEAEEYEVIKVDYHSTLGTGRNEFYIEALLVDNPQASIGFYDKEIGKSVFLTKAEAECAN